MTTEKALIPMPVPARRMGILDCWASRKGRSDWAESFRSPARRAQEPRFAWKSRSFHQTATIFCNRCPKTMKKEPKIRILVADDHYVVRMGVIAIINNEPDMEVVAEAANGVQAIEFCNEYNPDLILLDSRMPLKSGVEVAKEIQSQNGAVRILMLTAFDGDE